MGELQTNVGYMDAGQEGKWTVGRSLRFIGYSPSEPSYPECMHLVPGDLVVVVASNACGMGIDVQRVRDGYLTMVWPEEVENIHLPLT